jgi:hypothetical protein
MKILYGLIIFSIVIVSCEKKFVQTNDGIETQPIVESKETKEEIENISSIVLWDRYDWDIEIESKNIHYPKFHDSKINEMLKKYFSDNISETYFSDYFSVNINDLEFYNLRFEVTYEDVNIISIYFTALIINQGYIMPEHEIPIIIDKRGYKIYTSIDDVLKINDESINSIDSIFKDFYPNYLYSQEYYTMTEYYENFLRESVPLLTKDYLILSRHVAMGDFIKLPIEKIRKYMKIF